jgi:hypothetical protein
MDSEIRFSGVRSCPNCGQPWIKNVESSLEPILQNCADSIRNAVDSLNHYNKFLIDAGLKGFSVSLEIAASDRASSATD